MENNIASDRISWLERPNDDFPFYNGKPVELTSVQWIVVMVAAAIGFLCLILQIGNLGGPFGVFVPVILYVVVPLTGLALASKSHWTSLFRKITGRDILIMIGFALLNLAITFGMGALLTQIVETTANPAVAGLHEQTGMQQLMLYILAVPQLVGEEVMSILPFLALMTVSFAFLKTSRVTAILVATIGVAILFAIEHLHTYDWNVLQTLGGVGVARVVLLIPYIITKNLWVSAGAHILNDWSIFSLGVLASLSGVGG